MDNDFSAFEEYWGNYINRLTKEVKKKVGIALRETWRDFFVIAESKVRSMFNEAIAEFYSDYSPHEYDRNESLYRLLQTKVTSDSLAIWFDPNEMTGFRNGYSGEEGLYDQVFRRGWHGGAGRGEQHPSPGAPYWRVPTPYYTHWYLERPAEIAPVSPLDDIRNRIEEYQEIDMQSDFDRIWEGHIRNIDFEL